MNKQMPQLGVSEIIPIPPQCSDVTTVVRQVIVGSMTAAANLHGALIRARPTAKPFTCIISFKFYNPQGVCNIFSPIL